MLGSYYLVYEGTYQVVTRQLWLAATEAYFYSKINSKMFNTAVYIGRLCLWLTGFFHI